MMTSLNSRFINRHGTTSTSRTPTHSSFSANRAGQVGSGATATIGSVSTRPVPPGIHVASRTEVFNDRGLDIAKEVRFLCSLAVTCITEALSQSEDSTDDLEMGTMKRAPGDETFAPI